MISKAVIKYARISPRKVRMCISLIRGRYADEALAMLKNTNKRASAVLIKLLNSAIANAKRLPNIKEQDLYVSKVFADGGTMLKRFKAQAMGRASMIRRRTSHITLELDLKEQPPVEPAKIAKKPRRKEAVIAETPAAKPRVKKQAPSIKEKSIEEGAKSGA